jgi:Cu/Ag efflux pump CusA
MFLKVIRVGLFFDCLFFIVFYRVWVRWAIEHRRVTAGAGVSAFAVAIFLMVSGFIGSEFLPHLDEGAIWVRGTLAPSTGPTEGVRVTNQARIILASFPEVSVTTSQVGRPDDGTDTTGYFTQTKTSSSPQWTASLARCPGFSGIFRSRSRTTWKKRLAA